MHAMVSPVIAWGAQWHTNTDDNIAKLELNIEKVLHKMWAGRSRFVA